MGIDKKYQVMLVVLEELLTNFDIAFNVTTIEMSKDMRKEIKEAVLFLLGHFSQFVEMGVDDVTASNYRIKIADVLLR